MLRGPISCAGGDDLVTEDGERSGRPEPAARAGDVVPEELVRRYAGGETIESLAERYRLSYWKVRTRLLEAGVELRPPRIPLPPAPPGLVGAYEDGRTIRQLADRYGMTYGQTRRILLAEGVQLRPRGGKQ